ncbi:ribosome silencing factor, partial [Candidatus Saccharibacteria bacterium]|nr:ribosome silencing factor [Candidatus Saccharibacteria bacterium]NIW78875.1 ribosome silencing factor [Calditrichia bacterium]
HHVEKALRDRGIRPWHKEGFKNLKWVLLDFVDVVVHIFLPDTRDYYGLERLWADAKMIKVDENATVRNISERTN